MTWFARLALLAVPVLLAGCEETPSMIEIPIGITSPPSTGGTGTGTGTGAAAIGGTASFTGRESLTLDLLVVFDNSSSMDAEKTTLKQSLNGLMTALSARRGVDMRAAVTVTDGYHLEKCQDAAYRAAYGLSCGKFEGALVKAGGTSIATTASGRFTTDVAGLLSALPATPTRGWEQGLRAVEAALRIDGGRFQRAGVPTVVMVFTDVEDQSCDASIPQSQCDARNLKPVSSFADYFKSLGSTVQFIPFAGSSPSRCNTLESTSKRYFDLATLMGSGVQGDICLDGLHDDIIEAARHLEGRGNCYTLPSEAAGATRIMVTVDGKSIAEGGAAGFSYDQEARALCFPYDYSPGEGSRIEVSY